MWLFDVSYDKIDILVHPQSIIHSMVAFRDGSIIAQMAAPDMRIPIQLALTWPERLENPFKRVSLADFNKITFEQPDLDTFKAVKLSYHAAKIGGTMPCAMNAANEVAVDAFLKGQISFLQIPEVVEKVMQEHLVNTTPVLHDIIDTDEKSREKARNIINGGY
jgi:1-deoxy-D-xylulose-5-phosphate reductoisomerase